MTQFSGWSGYWADFLKLEKKTFIDKLKSYCQGLDWIKHVSDEQVNSWSIEFDVMQETLKRVLSEINGNDGRRGWISFEHELPGEDGKRAADVNLVLDSGYLFVIEFKNKIFPTNAEIMRAEFDLRTLQTFHSESKKLDGIGYLVLTRGGSLEFFHPIIHCDVSNNNILEKLKNDLITKLKLEEKYEISKWQHGYFDRPFNLMRGTVDLFLKNDFSHLTNNDVADSIQQSKEYLLNVFDQAKNEKQKHVVLVRGVAGAGKTLLGLTAIAEISQKYEREKIMPLYLSGNGPLVAVLRYTLDYAGRVLNRDGNSRALIESMINFKNQYLNGIRGNINKENFVVFDEVQRAWSNLGRKSFEYDGVVQTELHLLCHWLSHQEYGVLVLLYGDDQIIHDNEMDMFDWLNAFKSALVQWGHDFIVHLADKSPFNEVNICKQIQENKLLFLDHEIRQRYTKNLSLWISAVLEGNEVEAINISASLKAYPLLLTTDKTCAESYAINLLKVLHHKSSKSNSFKVGWLESSKGSNMLAQLNKSSTQTEIGQWYVEPFGASQSSCKFQKSSTEFSSQGLEMDLVLLNWGNDLLFREGKLKPQLYKRKKDEYTLGAYRVLLSRGKNGLIIKANDDETFAYLQRCGMTLIESAN